MMHHVTHLEGLKDRSSGCEARDTAAEGTLEAHAENRVLNCKEFNSKVPLFGVELGKSTGKHIIEYRQILSICHLGHAHVEEDSGLI
jgi:hypothetical protein